MTDVHVSMSSADPARALVGFGMTRTSTLPSLNAAAKSPMRWSGCRCCDGAAAAAAAAAGSANVSMECG